MNKTLLLIIAVGILSGCVSRQEVEGNLWLSDRIPQSLCDKNPQLKSLGVYRVVKCTNRKVVGCENGEPDYEEVISYCAKRIEQFINAERVYVEKWLKALGRPK